MNETRMRELESLLSEAFADEEFVTVLFALDTAEEAQAMLKDKGIEMTLDEVKRLPDAMAMARTGEGELSEDDLEDVAGGVGKLAFKLNELAFKAGYKFGAWVATNFT